MEKPLSPDELAVRLKRYLQTIRGSEDVDDLVAYLEDDDGLESVSSRRIKRAADTAHRMYRGRTVNKEALYHVEAIVHKKGRPSHVVHKNDYERFPTEFAKLNTAETKEDLQKPFRSIGRIDITGQNTYCGSGFVVADDLIMTNRHVAEMFTAGNPVKLQPWGCEIDFQEKPDSAEPDGCELTDCVLIHPRWDVAIFRAKLQGKFEPLTLSRASYADLQQRREMVVTVGYPARDRRNGLDVQRDIFGDTYGVKRIAPGYVTRRQQSISSTWLGGQSVDALTHDASTLGGNSGSAVIDVSTGLVVALHFAGRYLVENYGVPSRELLDDEFINAAGVRFKQAPINEPTSQAASPSNAQPTASPHNAGRQQDSLNPPTPDNRSSLPLDGNAVTIHIPLKITISIDRSE